MSMEYIRVNYGVPAKRGGRVEFRGAAIGGVLAGVIVGSRGQYIRVRMDRTGLIWTLHPTSDLIYVAC